MIFAYLLIVGLFILFINQNSTIFRLQKKVQFLEKEIENIKLKSTEQQVEGNTEFSKSEKNSHPDETSKLSTKDENLITRYPDVGYPSAKHQPLEDVFNSYPIATNTGIKENQLINKTIQFIKNNFLTIIGVVTLVLGIGYFVKYAIDKDWINETFRFIIGVFIGGIVIGIGLYLHKKYAIFSAILVGGGISILYFSITIAFREYHLFSQNFAFILLAFTTLLAIILSYLYNQMPLMIFAILGGFAAPLMISTGESNYIFLFTYLLLLVVGSVWINYTKNWKAIGYLTYALSIFYFFNWIDDLYTKWIFMYLLVYYLVFTLQILIPYLKSITFKQIDYIIYGSHQLIFTLFGYIAYEKFYTEFTSLIPLAIACINFAVFLYFNRRNHTVAQLSIAISIAMVTLAIGLEFEANVITSLWAIQSTLLLFLWKKTKDKVFKITFIGLIPVFIISLAFTWSKYLDASLSFPIIFNSIFATSCVVFVCSLINIYLIKEFNENEKFLGFEIHNAKNLFSIVSILFIYFGILFELVYQIEKIYSFNIISGSAILYTIFFASTILLFSRLFNINTSTKYAIGFINFGMMFIYPPVVSILNELLFEDKSVLFYLIYILYLIPFIYFTYTFFVKEEFKSLNQTKINQWVVFVVGVFVCCYEIFTIYMLATVNQQNMIESYDFHFDIYLKILLPILWALMGFGLIYSGAKKRIQILIVMGFVLFSLIVLKLYLIDVWSMSNEFRIASFIILGILILITSFMYQKLKMMMEELFEDHKKGTP